MAWSNQKKRRLFQNLSLFFGLIAGVLVILVEMKAFDDSSYIIVDHILTALVVVLAASLAGNFYFKKKDE